MGYRIGLTAKRKNGERKWRVFHLESGSWRSIKVGELSQLGLNQTLTYEQAKAIVRSLNHDGQSKRIERVLNATQERVLETQKAILLYLPQAFITEFEAHHFSEGKNLTALRYWQASKRCIVEVKTGIDALWKNPGLVYGYCQKKKFSLSYPIWWPQGICRPDVKTGA